MITTVTRQLDLRRWSLVAAGLAGIAVLLVLEDLSGGFLNQLLLYLPGFDKALHYVEYCLLFGALYWLTGLISNTPRARVALAIAGTLLLGVLDELQQSLAPDRSVELADYAANVCGLALGLALFVLRHRERSAALLALASLVGAVVVTYDSYTVTKDWARGQRYEQQQQFELARVRYLDALAAGLRTASLFNSISWVEIESGHGDAASAVEWGRKALAMKPGDADIMDTYGWALHHAGRTTEALGVLEEADRRKPLIYCVNYHLGVVLEALQRPQDARHRYEQQIRLFADASESRRARAALDAMQRSATNGGNGH